MIAPLLYGASLSFLYQPKNGQIWDPSCFAAANGTYYCISMYSEHGDAVYTSGWLARSDDGAHWRDVGPIAPSLPGKQWWKGFVMQTQTNPPKFVMNHGVYENRLNDALRILTSTDLTTWTVVSTSRPDTRWYHTEGRWDHMYMHKAADGSFIGFPVSSPLDAAKYAGTWPGIQRSPDGQNWTAFAPLSVNWGGLTPQGIEEGGIERLGNKYFLIGGGGAVDAPTSYSMWVFSSDQIEGPYQPVADMRIRLSGGGGRHDSFEWGALAVWARGRNDERLISQYMTTKGKGRADVWMLPMRKPVVSPSGGLQLTYWKGNDALTAGRLIYSAPSAKASCAGGSLGVTWLASLNSSEHDDGAVLIAELASVQGTGAIGVALEDVSSSSSSTTVNNQYTAALVDIGTDGDVSTASTVVRPAPPPDKMTILDRSGAFPCGPNNRTCGVATLTAVEPQHGSPPPGVRTRVMLFFRKGMWELYIKERLVQTFVYNLDMNLEHDSAAVGRVGLACRGDAELVVETVAIKQLSL